MYELKYDFTNVFTIGRNDLGMIVTMGLHWGNCESLIKFSSGMHGPRMGKVTSEGDLMSCPIRIIIVELR